IEHKWKTWIPWTVFGAGFAAAGIGGLLHWKATSDNASYTDYVKMVCADSCPDSSLNHSLLTTARVENGFGIGLLSAGGAAVVAGSVMIFLNRGHTVYDLESPTPRAHLDVVPSHDGGMVTLSGGF